MKIPQPSFSKGNLWKNPRIKASTGGYRAGTGSEGPGPKSSKNVERLLFIVLFIKTQSPYKYKIDKLEALKTFKLNGRILHFWRYFPVLAPILHFFQSFRGDWGDLKGLYVLYLWTNLVSPFRKCPLVQFMDFWRKMIQNRIDPEILTHLK